jgi:uncharacterized protein (TIGR02444 family)
MSDTETKTETTPFWRFSLNFYRQAGVSDACIALQDECGVDVNLLLFLFWLASEGRQLAANEVKKLDEEVRSWRELTVIPIRDARRRLKGARTAVDSGRQEAFRNKVKAVELEAERLQQEALYQFHRSGPLGKTALPKDAAHSNVGAYQHATGRNFPEKWVDVLIGGFDGAL